jgi:hypothetical protein
MKTWLNLRELVRVKNGLSVRCSELFKRAKDFSYDSWRQCYRSPHPGALHWGAEKMEPGPPHPLCTLSPSQASGKLRGVINHLWPSLGARSSVADAPVGRPAGCTGSQPAVVGPGGCCCLSPAPPGSDSPSHSHSAEAPSPAQVGTGGPLIMRPWDSSSIHPGNNQGFDPSCMLAWFSFLLQSPPE